MTELCYGCYFEAVFIYKIPQVVPATPVTPLGTCTETVATSNALRNISLATNMPTIKLRLKAYLRSRRSRSAEVE